MAIEEYKGDNTFNDFTYEDFYTEIYTLVDEEGYEIDFEVIYVLNHKGENYYALLPYYEEENDDYEEYFDDFLILKGMTEKDSDEEFFVSIDDEDEQDEIGEILKEKLSQIFKDIIIE